MGGPKSLLTLLRPGHLSRSLVAEELRFPTVRVVSPWERCWEDYLSFSDGKLFMGWTWVFQTFCIQSHGRYLSICVYIYTYLKKTCSKFTIFRHVRNLFWTTSGALKVSTTMILKGSMLEVLEVLEVLWPSSEASETQLLEIKVSKEIKFNLLPFLAPLVSQRNVCRLEW